MVRIFPGSVVSELTQIGSSPMLLKPVMSCFGEFKEKFFATKKRN
jgi:hypothetical protein